MEGHAFYTSHDKPAHIRQHHPASLGTNLYNNTRRAGGLLCSKQVVRASREQVSVLQHRLKISRLGRYSDRATSYRTPHTAHRTHLPAAAAAAATVVAAQHTDGSVVVLV